MRFAKHSELEGRHAYISASKYHWLRYSDEKFADTFRENRAAQHGSRLHEFGKEAILLQHKFPKTRTTLNMYVNDAIGFRMQPEVVLAYSDYAFGTADAISFKNGKLRIHDLKTGVHPAKFDQLIVYAAFFCLEYNQKPGQIEIELRIYQNDEIQILIPDLNDVVNAMGTIVKFSNMIETIMLEELD